MPCREIGSFISARLFFSIPYNTAVIVRGFVVPRAAEKKDALFSFEPQHLILERRKPMRLMTTNEYVVALMAIGF